jgi:ComF family protein
MQGITWCLDIFFPPRCVLCDRVLAPGKQDICPECRKSIRYLGDQVCLKCGKPVKQEEEYCYDCLHKKHLFIQGAALFPYEDVRQSLYRFKYGERQEYGRFFGRQMALHFEEKRRLWKPDALLPVPMYRRKQRKRGYNQAKLIADSLGEAWNIPVAEGLVVRVKNTRPMKEVDGTERQNNLKKAFKISENDVKLNTIIIIDDIYTTGSTVDAVAGVCLEAGIKNIYFLSVSIGAGL